MKFYTETSKQVEQNDKTNKQKKTPHKTGWYNQTVLPHISKCQSFFLVDASERHSRRPSGCQTIGDRRIKWSAKSEVLADGVHFPVCNTDSAADAMRRWHSVQLNHIIKSRKMSADVFNDDFNHIWHPLRITNSAGDLGLLELNRYLQTNERYVTSPRCGKDALHDQSEHSSQLGAVQHMYCCCAGASALIRTELL